MSRVNEGLARWSSENAIVHLCTDYELCPQCLLCIGCCDWHDIDDGAEAASCCSASCCCTRTRVPCGKHD